MLSWTGKAGNTLTGVMFWRNTQSAKALIVPSDNAMVLAEFVGELRKYGDRGDGIYCELFSAGLKPGYDVNDPIVAAGHVNSPRIPVSLTGQKGSLKMYGPLLPGQGITGAFQTGLDNRLCVYDGANWMPHKRLLGRQRLTSSSTNIVFDGLNSETYGGYDFELAYVGNGSGACVIGPLINNDALTTNYGRHAIYNITGTQAPAGIIASDYYFVNASQINGAYGLVTGSIDMIPVSDTQGYALISYTTKHYHGGAWIFLTGVIHYNVLISYINKIEFRASLANALGVGSRARLWSR
jgi:hypothetical protein